MKLVVIDYDSGNLRSVTRAIESQGVVPLVTGDPNHVDGADALVLPGVGSGPAAMTALSSSNGAKAPKIARATLLHVILRAPTAAG